MNFPFFIFYKIIILSYTVNINKKQDKRRWLKLKSRANYKEYIIDVILILFVVQLARINIKFILLKQLNFNLVNLIITTAISFALLGILLLLILKNNEIFNPTSLKIVNMFNQKNKQIRMVLGIIVILTFMITQYFEDAYNIYNIGLSFLLIIIII